VNPVHRGDNLNQLEHGESKDLRQGKRTLASGSTVSVHAYRFEEVLLVNYSIGGDRVLAALNYSDRRATVTAAALPGRWSALPDSASRRWDGPGSLADLNDPLSMPPTLVKAHAQLDRVVDVSCRPQSFTSERQWVECLFGLCEQMTAPLLPATKPKRPRQRVSA
jgi:hypothetical protein